jgi:hypothetical protein
LAKQEEEELERDWKRIIREKEAEYA